MNASAPRRLQGLRQDVELMCRNLADMVAFYRDTLGLPVMTQWSAVVRLDGGQGRWLTLWRADSAIEGGEVPFGRHSGVCFVVDDLERHYRTLRGAGLAFASAPCHQPRGGVMVNLIDPEGRLVTLVQHRCSAQGQGCGRLEIGDMAVEPVALASAC